MENPKEPAQQSQTKHEAAKPSWDTILVISCVIAVSVDPLFFYLPIINEELKCFGIDKSLRDAALLLRTLTDISFILNIIFQIGIVAEKIRVKEKSSLKKEKGRVISEQKPNKKIWFAKELAQKLSWHTVVIDILAVLPIPQVVIITIFFKTRSSRYLGQRKIMDVCLLAQYFPRIYRMHHSSRKLRQRSGVWIRGAFYFFLYILASHILGAFWYFFSIQRETSCWHQACVKHSTNGCDFYCDQDLSSRNMTFINSLDEFCLIDVPDNATRPFDFGIFLDSLKTGNTGDINFVKKISYSFWWGLRNLSNFGTNLETSTYVLENCFAILISIMGLLLFLYLIGNVQTFITMETEKAEERRKILISTEIDIQLWMDRNGLDKDTKKEIKDIVKKKSEKIRNADMENLFSILPPPTRTHLKRFLCMETLQKVPLKLKTLNQAEKIKSIQEKVLTSICDFLKPVVYQDNHLVFRMGEPLDRMLLITEGLIWTYNKGNGDNSEDGSTRTGSKCLGKGFSYGDELLSWASDSLTSLDNLPESKSNVKSHGKVEGFVLMAKELKTVVSRYKVYWGFKDSREQQEAAAQTIQNVWTKKKTIQNALKKGNFRIRKKQKKDQPEILEQCINADIV